MPDEMPEFDKPENIPLVVPDNTPILCIATTKAGEPCPMHPLKGEKYCLGHAKSIAPELRDKWRNTPKLVSRQMGRPCRAKYKTREEILEILSKRLDLWMEKFGGVLTEGIDDAICNLARTYAAVAKVEIGEGIEVRGWRMKGTA